MENLHPGARWIFRIRGFFGAVMLTWFLVFALFFPLLGWRSIVSEGSLLMAGLIMVFLFLFFTILFAEIYARLAYNN